MTTQEKKEYLFKVLDIDRQIDYLIKAIEKEKGKRDSLVQTTPKYERDGTQNGSHENSTENKFVEYSEMNEYIKMLQEKINKLYALKAKIVQITECVPDARQREILFRKYIEHEKTESIWRDMNYSKSQFWDIHSKAIQNLKISDKTGLNRT